MKYDAKSALLGGIIDYAGTFPPAALSLSQTLAHAMHFRKQGKQPWLMGRLTVTLSDLKKVGNRLLYDSGADGSAWVFTALGTPLDSQASHEWSKTIEWDLREIQHWEEKRRESSLRQEVVGYEIKLPLFATDAASSEFFKRLFDRWQRVASPQITPYFEVGLQGDWQQQLKAVATGLSVGLETLDNAALIPAIKVRTGGQWVPPADCLAEVLGTTTSYGFRFKATQGLHEAITHGNSYGFVNLFAAINLVQALGTDHFGKGAIKDCLTVEDPSAFSFGTNYFSFRNYRLDLETIEASRSRHGATFGSCSVDEPDESLAKTFP